MARKTHTPARPANQLTYDVPYKPPPSYDPVLAMKRQEKRELPTYSRKWRAIRKVQLATEPLCRICQSVNVTTEATVCDHIDEDSMNNHHTNLQSLCASCHNRKTQYARDPIARKSKIIKDIDQVQYVRSFKDVLNKSK